MLPHSVPDRPWSKVAVDLLQLQNQVYLLTVDYYSGFFEVNRMQSTRASTVIQALKSQFACHGIPEILISDNGSQFDCVEFKNFAVTWEFQHVTSSPHHHKSNGRVEEAVKTCKSFVNKAQESCGAVQLALLAAWNTPI